MEPSSKKRNCKNFRPAAVAFQGVSLLCCAWVWTPAASPRLAVCTELAVTALVEILTWGYKSLLEFLDHAFGEDRISMTWYIAATTVHVNWKTSLVRWNGKPFFRDKQFYLESLRKNNSATFLVGGSAFSFKNNNSSSTMPVAGDLGLWGTDHKKKSRNSYWDNWREGNTRLRMFARWKTFVTAKRGFCSILLITVTKVYDMFGSRNGFRGNDFTCLVFHKWEGFRPRMKIYYFPATKVFSSWSIFCHDLSKSSRISMTWYIAATTVQVNWKTSPVRWNGKPFFRDKQVCLEKLEKKQLRYSVCWWFSFSF